jgi:hypothetical protein
MSRASQNKTPHLISQRSVFVLAVPFLMVCAIVHFALSSALALTRIGIGK